MDYGQFSEDGYGHNTPGVIDIPNGGDPECRTVDGRPNYCVVHGVNPTCIGREGS